MTDIPENARRARQMYADGQTTREIMRQTKLTTWELYHWIEGGPKDNGVPVLPPLPKRKVKSRRRAVKSERTALVLRMMRAAEAQVGEIETRLAGTKQEPGTAERDARTLAILAKTIESLAALDATHKKDAPKPKASKPESVPRSIDELRRSLTRKLEAIIAERNSSALRES